MLGKEVLENIHSISSELIEFRRDLHMFPELGLEEVETTKKISDKLNSLGVHVDRFKSITGCLARIEGKSSKAICLRADIDALPLQDQKSCEYKSKIPGKMHACGHDVHTSIVLGAMAVLNKIPNLKKSVLGLFQPAEELAIGAKSVLKEQVLGDVETMLSLHVDPTLPVGSIAIKSGPLCACVIEFEMNFTGKTAHGARPFLGNDALLSACEFVSQCYTYINRRIDAREPQVLTIGVIKGGHASNIVSETCYLKGTIRAFKTEIARKVLDEVRRVAEGICLIHETHHELKVTIDLPAVCNDKSVASSMYDSLIQEFNPDNILNEYPTSLGGEDFGVYLESLKGAMMRLGVGKLGEEAPALHAQTFDIDERAIEIGIKALVASTLKFMS